MKCLTDEELAEYRRGVLREAAAFLRATAADYRQMASNVEVPGRAHFGRALAHATITSLTEKAKLLDGQAGHVEAL